MLLHGREAHRVMPGQLDDALLAIDRPADDVPSSGVREGAEHPVEVGRGDLHRYNHMVVSSRCQAGRRDGLGPSGGGELLEGMKVVGEPPDVDRDA